MKARGRALNIFSMSALDLFASALGAFILLAVIALPFFANTAQLDDASLLSQIAQTREELAQAQAELAQAQEELAQRQEELAQAQAELEEAAKANFMVVIMSWSTTDDVDLHVTDPAGNEFFYEQKEHPGSEAKLEVDVTTGPGNELWLHPKVTPGEYVVDYVYYTNRNGRPVRVRGTVLHRDGRIELPEVTLRSRSERQRAAVLRVSAENGRVQVAG